MTDIFKNLGGQLQETPEDRKNIEAAKEAILGSKAS